MLGLNTHDNIEGELEKIFQNNDCSREASNNRRHKVRQKMLLAMLPQASQNGGISSLVIDSGVVVLLDGRVVFRDAVDGGPVDAVELFEASALEAVTDED